MVCPKCDRIYRSAQLSRIVPDGGNFGYDIIVCVGKALFLQNLAEQMVVERLASDNIYISFSEIAYMGKKFIVYLTLAHRESACRIKESIGLKGGYILHLDATYENKSPLLMIGMDSIMKIVLSNIKLRSEKSDEIVPFLKDIQNLFGDPLASVHDMSRGIIKAVGIAFPGIPDFICHFHFLRDIGKDLLGQEYNNIRNRLKRHGIKGKLRQRLRYLEKKVEINPQLIEILAAGMEEEYSGFEKYLGHMPVLAAYSLILWALDGQNQGNGYGFPFDRPHFVMATRLKRIQEEISQLRNIRLRRKYNDNAPLHKTFSDFEDIVKDKSLWSSVNKIETEAAIFDGLREALRIAPRTSKKGLNYTGNPCDIRSIENRVKEFKRRVVANKMYSENESHQKMIGQIDKYWEKLFADPIEVETPNGKIKIQPHRTNNIEENEIRDLKRGYRKKTGNSSLGKTLRSMLENTPLVKNLKNDEYMSILLNGRSNLEEVFADTEIKEVRGELKRAIRNPEKIPVKLKKLTRRETYPDELKQLFAGLKSNGILC